MKKFYRCDHCGNIVEMIEDKGVPIICCGEPMKEVIANTTDAAIEKHVPAVSVDGDTVHVVIGDVEHPMLKEHYIQWIQIETKYGIQRQVLHPEEPPKATFVLTKGDELKAVYEYCNLHGLWKKDI